MATAREVEGNLSWTYALLRGVSHREATLMKASKASISAVALCCTFMAGAAFANDDDSRQPVTDTVITTKVKAELAAEDETKARNINVTTENGVVRLSGMVDSAAEKKEAEKEARSVEGVTKVDNQLTVKR
jgi:hyperosmotically inducible periplasmic protein